MAEKVKNKEYGFMKDIKSKKERLAQATKYLLDFMFYSGIFTIVICGLWLVFTGNKVPLFKGKRLLYSAGDGILNGVGDLLLLIALVKLPASVQYPLVTGGVMVCSTLISTIRREDVKKLDYIAAVIALGASIMIAF